MQRSLTYLKTVAIILVEHNNASIRRGRHDGAHAVDGKERYNPRWMKLSTKC